MILYFLTLELNLLLGFLAVAAIRCRFRKRIWSPENVALHTAPYLALSELKKTFTGLMIHVGTSVTATRN